MSPKEALDILGSLASQVKATLQEHEVLQTALVTLKKLVDAADATS